MHNMQRYSTKNSQAKLLLQCAQLSLRVEFAREADSGVCGALLAAERTSDQLRSQVKFPRRCAAPECSQQPEPLNYKTGYCE